MNNDRYKDLEQKKENVGAQLRACLIATVPFGWPIQMTVSFRFEMVQTK